jgi:hypothetical protein
VVLRALPRLIVGADALNGDSASTLSQKMGTDRGNSNSVVERETVLQNEVWHDEAGK